MNIVDVVWFSNIGVVLATNDQGVPVAYIGQGDGYNEKMDKQHIADWGAHFTEYAADKIYAHFHKKEEKQP